MKVSDYIIKDLIDKKVKAIFGYPGGMVTHIMDSLNKYQDDIDTYLNYNEQASAFAACGYAQISHNLGVAYATSGPGATNLVTGIANAYFDSIPCLFITGQVNTYEQKHNLKCRQKGFQETDIVSIVKSITKYAVMIDKKEDIVYELEKAYQIATQGRPGPVLLDIPMNIQREEINVDECRRYCKTKDNENIDYNKIEKTIIEKIKKAKRPVIIAGAGIQIANVKEEFLNLIEAWKVPVVTTMIARDALPYKSNYNYGFIGAYGQRYSNIILSKSDCILTLGTRLSKRQIGDIKYFNKEAVKLRVDIDEGELTNILGENEIQLIGDLKVLIKKLSNKTIHDNSNWLYECIKIKQKLKNIDKTSQTEMINKLSKYIPDNTNIVTDVGQNQVWVAQSFEVKDNQRILFSGGHGAMGYSLPASIGAYYANKKKTISINGDGGLQMNIQELEFLARENIPIKVIVINNHSLGMIRHFQEMYFDNRYALTTQNTGYHTPDFCKIAEAYGIENYNINDINNLKQIEPALRHNKPILVNIDIGDITYIYPKLGINQPIYNQEPKLDNKLLQELLKNK